MEPQLRTLLPGSVSPSRDTSLTSEDPWSCRGFSWASPQARGAAGAPGAPCALPPGPSAPSAGAAAAGTLVQTVGSGGPGGSVLAGYLIPPSRLQNFNPHLTNQSFPLRAACLRAAPRQLFHTHF